MTTPIPRIAIKRVAILDDIDAASTHRLTLVIAPAGAGKSVTLAQWAARRSDVVTVTVGELEHDAIPFASQLLAALAGAASRTVRSSLDQLDPRATSLGGQFIDALLKDLDRVEMPLTIVIDDVDRLGPDIHSDLRHLIAGVRDNVHFVMSARADPDLGQGRLRRSGDAADIRLDRLHFDADESRQLVELIADRMLDQVQMGQVMALTEGWPIAVHLAGLALRSADDIDVCLAEFESNDRNVADYLSAEVLRHLDPGDRDLLVRSSVLPLLDGELCDDALGIVGSAARLDDLERRGVLLVRLAHDRYRLHRLVREYLRFDLGRADPGAARRVLRSAAMSSSRRGDDITAGDLLVEAKDWDLLRQLTLDSARAAWESGEFGPIRRWIAALPDDPDDLVVGVTGAVIDLISGHTEAGEFTLQRMRRTAKTDEERFIVLAASTAGIDSVCALNEIIGDAAAVEVLAERIDPDAVPVILGLDTETVLAFTRLHARRASLYLGHASEPPFTATRAKESAGQPTLHLVNIHAQDAVAAALCGELHQAEVSLGRATYLASDSLGPHHPSLILAGLAAGMVALGRHDVDMARRELVLAGELADLWRRWSGARLISIELARAAEALGEPGALELTDQLMAYPAPAPTTWIMDRALMVESAAWLRAGKPAQASTTLDRTTSRNGDGVAGGRALLALAGGDLAAARAALRRWVPDHRFGGTWRNLLAGVADHLGGDETAGARLDIVVRDLEHEGHVLPLLECGPIVLDAVRNAIPRRSFLVEQAWGATEKPGPFTSALIDPLTDRELSVLAYLPSRMTNADIARELYVSVNTVRTHVRHIYQKLGVATRDAAIAKAVEQRLLVEQPQSSSWASPVGSSV